MHGISKTYPVEVAQVEETLLEIHPTRTKSDDKPCEIVVVTDRRRVTFGPGNVGMQDFFDDKGVYKDAVHANLDAAAAGRVWDLFCEQFPYPVEARVEVETP